MNYLCRKIEIFIGVHIRRTDYLNHLKNTYLVEPVKLDYFYRAMDFYQVKLLTVVYVPAIMWMFDCVVETISVRTFQKIITAHKSGYLFRVIVHQFIIHCLITKICIIT